MYKMKYTARDFVRLIEMNRYDKVGRSGLMLIARRFRELENQEQKLPIDLVSKRNWFEKLPLHWKLLLHTGVGVLLGLTIAYVC